MTSPLHNLGLAFAISLALHAVLAVAVALYLEYAPAPDELAQLDLTSVELSFAETVEESAAATPPPVDDSPPSVDAASPPRPTATVLSTPDAARTPRPQNEEPPRPQEAILPTPAEPISQLPAPTIVKTEDMRQETRDETKQKTKDERQATDDAARTPRPQAAAAPRQARVDAPARPKRSIRPDYPRESRLRGEHGDVTLELTVAADGTVGDVRVIKSPGFSLLDEAAVKAVRAAHFTPAKSEGKPVSSTARLTLTFKLK